MTGKLVLFRSRRIRRWALKTTLYVGFLPSAYSGSLVPELDSNQARFGVDQDSYPLLKPRNTETLTNATQLYGRVKLNLEGSLIEAGAEAEARSTAQNTEYASYVFIKEAWIGTSSKASETSQLTIGRQPVQWSALDEQWKLGIAQPRIRWDYLRPETAGLTGVFLHHKTALTEATVYGSPFFLPDQGPSVRFDNGAILSPSPWFSPPTTSIDLFGRPTQVRYALNTPSIASVILNPSWGTTVRIGGATGFWGRTSYEHKPMSQFALSYAGTLNLQTLTADLSLAPLMVYHHVAAMDLGYQNERVRFTISGLMEVPSKQVTTLVPAPAPDATVQSLGRSWAAGPHLDWKVLEVDRNPLSFGAGYMHLVTQYTQDRGPLAPKDRDSAFESRFPFQRAFTVYGRIPGFYSWLNRFSLRSAWTYDLAQSGAIFSNELTFNAWNGVKFIAGCDLIGIDPSEPAQGSIDWIRRYSNNDRVYGGIAYVF